MASQSMAAADVKAVAGAGKNYGPALAMLTSLFFMWGFITCLNDIMIPHLKGLFVMTNLETMLIQFTFFGAYFLMSLPAGFIVGKVGYQRGIVLGLVTTGIGALLFYPASIIINYAFFLFAFFVLASGITILQVAANPYVAILGKPENASSRLNMTQALNSFGTTIAPLLGAVFIFVDESAPAIEKAESVQMPYIGIAVTLFLIALVFAFAKLPKIESQNETKDVSASSKKSAWNFPHLVKGAISIFLYVGAEVAIGSFLILFFAEPEIAGLSHQAGAKYVALYWGGAMIGRFLGAVMLSDTVKDLKYYGLILAIAVGATILGWSINKDIEMALIFLAFTGLNILAFMIGKNKPARTLAIFAAIVVGLVSTTVFFSGHFAMWTIVSVGLFNSIMFPTIFTLAIDGLEEHTSQGSGILCMAIVGGAIIPLLMGYVSDIMGYHHAFIITLACYAYIFYYAVRGHLHK
ncbi:MAG: sugar MFS transporter [Marinifilaceae bacterium]|jgi:FHS family L-fucose permease-like MFS transporter